MNELNKSKTLMRAEPDADGVPAYLGRLWQELLRIDEVSPDDGFFALGGDSVLVVEMLITVQAHFDREFEFGKFFPNPNLSTLSTLIAEQLESTHDRV